MRRPHNVKRAIVQGFTLFLYVYVKSKNITIGTVAGKYFMNCLQEGVLLHVEDIDVRKIPSKIDLENRLLCIC